MTEPVSSSLPICRDLIQSIVAAVDARDVYTAHHSDRVAAMAVVLARVLHLSEDDTTTVQVAAFAHDIGKISMSDAVLRKAGPLTDAEWEEMRRCPVTGYDILRKVPQFQRTFFDGAYRVRYILLDEENPTYSAMSGVYREYLVQAGVLKKAGAAGVYCAALARSAR